AAFLGHFSTDEFGRMLADQLAADGASLALATFGPEPTTIAVANIGGDGLAEYEFLIQGTSAPNLTLDMIPAELPVEVKAVHLGTLGLVLEPMASSLAALVRREHGRRLVMLDPNIRPVLTTDPQYRPRLDSLISQSTIVKASDADLDWLFQGLDRMAAARALLARGPKMVVVTLGAKGAIGVTASAEVRVPAPAVRVVDTIGAGDAFGAALLAWLHDHGRLSRDLRLDREELRAALEFACLVASITCTRPGADPPRRAELKSRR
ncbi:MAG: carbohydrate kinase, partial [Chloroflexi bacterium]